MPNNPLHPRAYSKKSFVDDLIKKHHFQKFGVEMQSHIEAMKVIFRNSEKRNP